MYNILVCDDDKEIVKAIEIYLIGEKYNVLTRMYTNAIIRPWQTNEILNRCHPGSIA